MLNNLIERYPSLSGCKNELESVKALIIECFENGGKLLLCGNGGSSADCDHIVGELMKGFMLKRPISKEKRDAMKEKNPEIADSVLDKLQMGLPAIALPSVTALNTAFANDVDPDLTYAQSLFALGGESDLLLAISTSGNAKNVIHAVEVAKSLGIKTVGLSGKDGGALGKLTDVCIIAPENETYKIQELHLPIYHWLCAEVEKHFFG